MKSNNIKSFRVEGLFGTNDINILFEENTKILIGENGLGKTQILNPLYYTLTCNFFRLNDFNFKKLFLEFQNVIIEIEKKEISNILERFYKDSEIKDFIKEFGYAQFEFLRNRFKQSKRKSYELERMLEGNSKFRKYPIHRLFRYFEDFEKEFKFDELFKLLELKIKKEIGESEIMYFPTYRRVEEDLHNLGYDDDEFIEEESGLIQFGMDDVQRKFIQLENTIDNLLKNGISSFTKDLLKIITSNNSKVNDKIFDKINDTDLEIIFSRIGSSLDIDTKNTVKESVKTKKFPNEASALLLQKLVELYDEQKPFDKSIKIFRDICNKYLINKEVFYDESAIKIYIKSKITNNKIDLKDLSSGEKQIISVFAKIYLSSDDKRFIVLFDEPELSLSMLWQKELLPDIVNSKKCNFLLAVTHSPFIFDNELNKYAVGLNEYFSLSESIV
jgi:predicted ATP-dependent endonuclease of OLD family